MRAFNHHNASSVDEALDLLREYEGKARLIAGGTDLLGILKDDLFLDYPEALINIKTIPGLDYIKEDEEGLKIGALARLSQIVHSPEVESNYVILKEAAKSAGTPELQNMGTIGGNLCQENRCWYYRYPQQMGGRILCYCKGRYPCPAVKGDNRYNAILGVKGCFAVCPSDTAIALAALDANLIVAHPDGEMVLPVIDLYDRLGHTILRPDKILTEIRVPKLPDNAAQAFIKFRLRESVDFAIVSVASVITMADGFCQDARIILGAVAPMPFRAVAAEEALRGKPLDVKTVEQAAEAAVSKARPLSDNRYKIEITKTLVKRALLSCRE
jgi:xanthine dehydrogenase YagS FAD-binding subunit